MGTGKHASESQKEHKEQYAKNSPKLRVRRFYSVMHYLKGRKP